MSEEELARLKDLAEGKNPGYLKSILRGAMLGGGLWGSAGMTGGLLGASTINAMANTNLDEQGRIDWGEPQGIGELGRIGQNLGLGSHRGMATVGGLTGLGLGVLGGGLHGLYNHFIDKERLQELAKLQLAAVSKNK